LIAGFVASASVAVKPAAWIMKCGITRWKIVPVEELSFV